MPDRPPFTGRVLLPIVTQPHRHRELRRKLREPFRIQRALVNLDQRWARNDRKCIEGERCRVGAGALKGHPVVDLLEGALKGLRRE